MSAERVNEICTQSGGIFGRKMAELANTDKERDFMRSAINRGNDVIVRLRDMVKEGITFDAWREYFLDVSGNIGGKEFFNEEELAALSEHHTELSQLDLRVYFDTVVIPYINLDQLERDVVELARQREVMEDIWMEEDELKTIAPASTSV